MVVDIDCLYVYIKKRLLDQDSTFSPHFGRRESLNHRLYSCKVDVYHLRSRSDVEPRLAIINSHR